MLFDVFRVFRYAYTMQVSLYVRIFYPIDIRDTDKIKIVQNSYNFKYTSIISISVLLYSSEISIRSIYLYT